MCVWSFYDIAKWMITFLWPSLGNFFGFSLKFKIITSAIRIVTDKTTEIISKYRLLIFLPKQQMFIKRIFVICNNHFYWGSWRPLLLIFVFKTLVDCIDGCEWSCNRLYIIIYKILSAEWFSPNLLWAWFESLYSL